MPCLDGEDPDLPKHLPCNNLMGAIDLAPESVPLIRRYVELALRVDLKNRVRRNFQQLAKAPLSSNLRARILLTGDQLRIMLLRSLCGGKVGQDGYISCDDPIGVREWYRPEAHVDKTTVVPLPANFYGSAYDGLRIAPLSCMLPISRILVAVDFSERCLGIMPYVRAIAERYNSEVNLLHPVNRVYAIPAAGITELALMPVPQWVVTAKQSRLKNSLPLSCKALPCAGWCMKAIPNHKLPVSPKTCSL